MTSTMIPDSITSTLNTASSNSHRTVLLTCGISGSGKSTLAQTIVSQYPKFVRLSIDKYIFEHHGVFGSDYGEEVYEDLQDEARAWIREELERVVREGERDVVLDLSLWNKEERDYWRGLVRGEGGEGYQVILVVFEVTEELLWGRIQMRETRLAEEGMGEGRPVGRDLLARFVRGFEWPVGEGEIIIHVV